MARAHKPHGPPRRRAGAPYDSGAGETERRRALQANQIEHTGVLLWWATRAWMAEFRRRIDGAGYADLPEGAFQSLLPFLDVEGTRTTVLAERAGISKQAVNQFVDRLEAAGYVERAGDPADGRAKVIRYAGRGLDFVRDNQRIKRELEADVERALGRGRLTPFHDELRKMIERLKPDSRSQ